MGKLCSDIMQLCSKSSVHCSLSLRRISVFSLMATLSDFLIHKLQLLYVFLDFLDDTKTLLFQLKINKLRIFKEKVKSHEREETTSQFF